MKYQLLYEYNRTTAMNYNDDDNNNNYYYYYYYYCTTNTTEQRRSPTKRHLKHYIWHVRGIVFKLRYRHAFSVSPESSFS